jgi:hypothetical protein
MNEQTNQESEKTYTLEEIAQKRADAISFYTNQIAVLTVQAEFEKLQADIEESRTRRLGNIIKQAQMTELPEPEETPEETPEPTRKPRDLKKS